MDIFYAIPKLNGKQDAQAKMPLIHALTCDINVILSEAPIPQLGDLPSKRDLERLVTSDVLIADMDPPTPYVGHCVAEALYCLIPVLALYPYYIDRGSIKIVPNGISIAKFSNVDRAVSHIKYFLRLVQRVMPDKKR